MLKDVCTILVPINLNPFGSWSFLKTWWSLLVIWCYIIFAWIFSSIKHQHLLSHAITEGQKIFMWLSWVLLTPGFPWCFREAVSCGYVSWKFDWVYIHVEDIHSLYSAWLLARGSMAYPTGPDTKLSSRLHELLHRNDPNKGAGSPSRWVIHERDRGENHNAFYVTRSDTNHLCGIFLLLSTNPVKMWKKTTEGQMISGGRHH